MSQRTAVLLVVLVCAVSWIGTAQVVATHAVWGELAGIVGGEEVLVKTIIPSGFCPSHYDLRPSDIAAIADAKIILYSGMEPWLETLLSSLGHAGAAVQLPGIWNTPDAAAQKLETIYAVLAGAMPEHQELFRARTDTYLDELKALGEALRTAADERNAAGAAVICMQWQAAFVEWLGFDVIATFPPPEQLSLRDLVTLAEAGRDAGAVAVIDNLQSGVDFGAKLAREIDAVHVVFSNFPGAMPATATLLDLLERNAGALFSAIEPIEGVSDES